MSQYGPTFPGIASATGTRVDSASKHIMACKVNDVLLAQWCEDQRNPRNCMHINRMKYCVHKDEVVLNCGMALNEKGTMLNSNYAYPSVVSTLGDMTDAAKKVLIGLYADGGTGERFIQTKNMIAEECVNEQKFKQQFPWVQDVQRTMVEVKNMPHFLPQGIALGIAYASSLSGDTVSSVLIGGMATVMNGAFEMRAGQMVQFYFDFEANAFHTTAGGHGPSGTRKRRGNVLFNENELTEFMQKPKMTQQESQRNDFHKRQLGSEDSFGDAGTGPGSAKRNVAYIKPYMLTEDGQDHYADKIRVFAKCINGGRAHEPVDIMMMTQSL